MRFTTLATIITIALLCAPLAAASLRTGTWRVVLDSPGGELPFSIRVDQRGDDQVAFIINDVEQIEVPHVATNGREVVIDMPWYDAALRARLDDDGTTMRGRWVKATSRGTSELPMTAVWNDTRRFVEPNRPDGHPAPPERSIVTGDWEVTFRDDSGAAQARARFRQTGTRAVGTFMTPTGDYRFLEGQCIDGRLELSCFDGAHAFLFTARMTAEGTLDGDFYSRDVYHATWSARRLSAEEANTASHDPLALTTITSPDGRFRFAFDDMHGQRVTSDDERFRDRPLIVNIFGTWCPNCHDEAPLLAEWHRRHRDAGLEIVGLAFEVSDDDDRNRRQLRRFAERHGIEYPLLLAGPANKTEAARALPDLSAVIAYPTTLFIDRRGVVRHVYTGFSGPATGVEHELLVTRFETMLADR